MGFRAIEGSPWVLWAVAGTATIVVALGAAQAAVNALGFGLQIVFFLYFTRHLLLSVAALRGMRSDDQPLNIDNNHRPPVTVLVACKNEVAVVEGLVGSLLALHYPRHRLQLVVVDDGSTDGTAAVLGQMATTHPRLHLVRRSTSGGKPAALNSGLEIATGEIVVVFDADHRPHVDVLLRLARHFEDPAVGAVQGRCIIRNAEETPITRLVALDYLAGYLVNEYGRHSIYQLPAYGGANCAVRTADLRAVGGWNVNTVTEDTDLTLRLVLAGRRIRYDVSAVDEEEAVLTMSGYWKQRYRWARGHQKAWRDYRKAVWSSPRLSPAEKVETLMFLLAFHVPVISGLGLVTLVLWLAGIVQPHQAFDTSLLWTLLFLGPLLELGGALLAADADRRESLVLVWFLPMFIVSIALCTKAWLDGVAGRPYTWVKTKRAGEDPLARSVTRVGVR